MIEQRPKTQHHSHGFTLAELLVTIAVLGVLAGSILVVINPIRMFAQARDSSRISALGQIREALKIYYNENWQVYPPGYRGDGTYGYCSGEEELYQTFDLADSAHCVTNALIHGGYVKSLPSPNVQTTSAPDYCKDRFDFIVGPQEPFFSEIGSFSHNAHYLIRFCIESWGEDGTQRYQTEYMFGDSRDYTPAATHPPCNYDTDARVTICYLYDWNKLPPKSM